MKTETERLREATEAQYRKERFEELQTYIDGLYDEMTTAFEASKRHFRLEILSLVTWIIVLLVMGDGILETLTWLIWFLLAIFDWMIYKPRVLKALSRLDSCFETLRILGLISRDDENGRKKKLRKFRDNPIERLWAKIKSKMQQEMYGTT